MKYTQQQILVALKKRQTLLQKRIDHESANIHNLRHKSRSVRMNSPLHRRIGFFKDLELEIDYAIRLIEGKLTVNNYVKMNNGDELDMLASGLCGG
jgi:hypothetical protein